MDKNDIAEMEETLTRAKKESALIAAKAAMKSLEEWKKRHPRPNHKKEAGTE